MATEPEPEEDVAPPLLRQAPTRVTGLDLAPTPTPWWYFWRRLGFARRRIC